MLVQGLNSNGELIRDVYVEHAPVDLFCPDDGMARQEFADECDINVLMSRYERTGVLNHYNAGAPQYLDVTDVPDLARSFEILDAAETAFMRLPATVRREFGNDPIRFVEYASDPANVGRMREWGLAAPAPVADAIIPKDGAPLDGGAK